MDKTAVIRVRDARREDAARVAELIVMAWPVEEFLAMQEGLTLERFTDMIRTFVEAEDNVYSYRYAKVAEVLMPDGSFRVAGMMNGYDGARYQELKQPVLDVMTREFGSGGDFGNAVETEAGEFYLDSAGVDPSMRSMGIGSRLFKAMLERAAAEGQGPVRLSSENYHVAIYFGRRVRAQGIRGERRSLRHPQE